MDRVAITTDHATDKLDSLLWEMYNRGELSGGDAVSVMIRCAPGSIDHLANLVTDAGGKVQRKLATVRVVVAWLPPMRVLDLANDPSVLGIAQEQQYTVA